jgi:hypothetical protein
MKHGHRWLIGALVVIALAIALALITTSGKGSLAAHGVIYVDADATGLNDGGTWDNAYTDLQPALDAAPISGGQIWVAEGVYTPTREFSPGDPRSATFQLKNGVALYGGFDPSVGASEWEDRDWEANPAILSGDLNGDDVPPFGNNEENSYHVFYHPESLALDGSAILDGFIVTGGNADDFYSGPHDMGGGMHNNSSSPTLANCRFVGNWAGYGGATCNGGSSPTLTNCTFQGNSARYGGGVWNSSPSPTLINCTFADNSADVDAGGMYNYEEGSPTLINCIFARNSAEYTGGAMANWMPTSPTLINCTFTDNSAGVHGGGLFNGLDSSPTLTNCILWSDSPDEIRNSDLTSLPAATYSDVQGGYPGVGNIDADPLFVDPANGDYHLGSWSPALGAGTIDGAPSTDTEGNPRPDPPGSSPDMGAYESPLPRVRQIWHIATTGSDVAGDGSESNPFATIQHGIDVSIDGDAVLVHTGIYTENISFKGKNISVRSLFLFSGDEDYIAQTVIDGNQNGSVVTFMNGEGPAAVLSGLTIVNGYAHEATWPYNDGGGICVVDAAPQLSHLYIISNTAINEGGGVYLGQNQVSEEVARVSNCIISDNSAGSSGGGIRFSSDNGRIAVVESSVITGNQANRGAGVHIYHSGILENCLIASNTSATNAGGVYVDWGSRGAFITNSTIVDNSAPSFGGLDYVINGATVRNSIIFNNDNGNWNGGSYTHSCTSPLPGGIGNIDADPLFVAAGSGDYHLGPGSPCIDAGDNSPPIPRYDFEGHPRIMDGDRDGMAVVDMGVDEVFGYGLYLPLYMRSSGPSPIPIPTPTRRPRPTNTPRPRPTNTPTG